MQDQPAHKRDIPTLVKDPSLVEKRRRQIVDAAVRLFVDKGFHKTTTREIARVSGLSIGSLYEYIQSKEDVLYLVCETIHAAIRERLEKNIHTQSNGRTQLEQAINEYFQVCDEMADMILLIYQETNSLPPDSLRYVLQDEERITHIFRDILEQGVETGAIKIRDGKTLTIIAHTIAVLGHMWTFRRWSLHRNFTLGEYTKTQTEMILNFID
ncbi:MAG: TetR/AcrR family transcriptional regulator [Deltaproteobacteria bacterium]|nr:TetR/AcrR family transcriptional regulator [Deltaproteobacteria bacterium]